MNPGRTDRDHFPPFVTETLAYYVYLLRDPRTHEVFYVGKGAGDRVFAHARDAVEAEDETPKLDLIREIIASGKVVEAELLRFGMDEKQAFEVEAAAIDLLGLTDLTNAVAGHGTGDRGRMSTDEAIFSIQAEPISIDEPSILIKPSQMWFRGMPADDLFEATRGWWRVGTRREGAMYGIAVVHGVVRGVWEIEEWRPRRQGERGWEEDQPGRFRWGFEGRAATDLMEKYSGKSVAHYWKQGAQSPFIYVNC